MNFLSMLWCEILICFSRRRWVAAPLFAFVLAALVLADIGTRRWGLQPANQWDILLGVFNNKFIVVVLLPVVFLALVTDSITFDTEGRAHLTLVRLPSRAVWWWSKVGLMGAASFVYVSVMFLCVGFTSTPAVPLQWSWSRLVLLSGWAYPGGLPISHLHTPPPVIILKIFGLIWLGLFALGTAVATLGFITRYAIIGWIAGAVAVLVSYGTWSVWGPTLHLFLSAHREFNGGVPGSPTLWWSVLLDGAMLTASVLVGYLFTLRRDF